MVDKTTKEKKTKDLKTSLIVFCVLLFLILGFMFYMRNLMPSHMMSQGKKYYELGDYKRALKMFDMAVDANPFDSEPVYYKALALSKLEPTYENQKALYEIAQLEDCEEASDYAEEVLKSMRKAIDKSIGSNYADNILYEDVLIRWNNNEPITYYVSAHMSVPAMYEETVRKAFSNWQIASQNTIKFKEVQNAKNAKITVTFVESLESRFTSGNPNLSASVLPVINEDKLSKMEIDIKRNDVYSRPFTEENLMTLAQHQIGHALGLWGHSADKDDIMYYSGDVVDYETVKKDITRRDINTLLLLYKMIPDIIDTPLSPEQMSNMFYHNVITSYPGENFELEIQRLISQLKYDRQNIIVWVDLAINYAYKKLYSRSNYILEKILPLVANDFANQHVILYNLAANFYKMEEYNMSERYLNAAIRLQDDLDTQILEAFLDLRLGREIMAREKLELLNNSYPDHIEVALKLAKEKGVLDGVLASLVKNGLITKQQETKYMAEMTSQSIDNINSLAILFKERDFRI